MGAICNLLIRRFELIRAAVFETAACFSVPGNG
jgi:hypothetical protein